MRYNWEDTVLLLVLSEQTAGKVRVGSAAIYPHSSVSPGHFYKLYALDEGASVVKVSPDGRIPIIRGTATDLSPGQMLTNQEREAILEQLRKGATPRKIARRYELKEPTE